MGRLQKIVPVIRLAQLGANPQIRVIVAPMGATAELAHTIEHIGNRHARAGNRRRRFGGESQVERGALGSGQVTGNLTQRAGTRPTQALKQHARLICRNHARPLATGLTLDGMGLVDHPVTNRRQNPSLGGHVAEQQGMVGDHHVGMCRSTARPVDQAFVREERTQTTSTLARSRRKVGTVDAAPANAERIEVAIGRLAHIRHDHRNRRERVSRIALGGDLNLTTAHALELA